MTSSERHAEQVFAHIEAGNFYMVTDNVRPYVDVISDLPFDGVGVMKSERHANMQALTLDNIDAWQRDLAWPQVQLAENVWRSRSRI